MLGPDPASEVACTIGGVIANNSSGRACGVAHNTYHTLESAVVVLPSGTIIDSAAPDADETLRAAEPEIHETLARLRRIVTEDERLATEIRRQFSIKNTMGYSINALLDEESPAQMLIRLMVGSEGTLGFMAKATFRTVPRHPAAATTLLVFDSLRGATDSLVDIVDSGATTIELIDAASLRAARANLEFAPVLPDGDYRPLRPARRVPGARRHEPGAHAPGRGHVVQHHGQRVVLRNDQRLETPRTALADAQAAVCVDRRRASQRNDRAPGGPSQCRSKSCREPAKGFSSL